MDKPKEHKTFPAVVTGIDEDQGIVEHIVAVMGNLDEGKDIIHPGAFTKTIAERGGRIRVLDHHNSDSIMRVIGKPLAMRELDKAEVPPQVFEKAPDATGALWVKTQYLMDTPEGLGAFKRIKAGAVDEYSIGYDPLDVDYSDIERDGKKITARNLRTIKLFEYSPVIFGMNPATTTLDAKSEDEPDEGKPYRAFHEGDKWVVYKIDEEGQPVGDALGTHDSEEEATAQIRALYANEDEDKAAMRTEADGEHPAGHYLVVEDAEKPSTWHLRVRDASGELDHRLMGAAWAALHGGYRGNAYDGPGKDEAVSKLRALYESEDIDTPKATAWDFETQKAEKAGRVLAARNAKRIMDAMRLLHDALSDAGLMDAPDDEDSKSAPERAALNTEHKAGPHDAPTSEMEDISALLREIEFEQSYLDIMEV